MGRAAYADPDEARRAFYVGMNLRALGARKVLDAFKRVIWFYEDDKMAVVEDVMEDDKCGYDAKRLIVDKANARLAIAMNNCNVYYDAFKLAADVPATADEINVVLDAMRKVRTFRHVKALYDMFKYVADARVSDDEDVDVERLKEMAKWIG